MCVSIWRRHFRHTTTWECAKGCTVAEEVVDAAIEVLNRALSADPRAIAELLLYRHVECNSVLGEDETIQVRLSGDAVYSVGALGLINGLFGIRRCGAGNIEVKLAGSSIIGFSRHLCSTCACNHPDGCPVPHTEDSDLCKWHYNDAVRASVYR